MNWRKRPELERSPVYFGVDKLRTLQVLAGAQIQQPKWHRCPRTECLRARMCMAPRACEVK